MGGMTIAHSVRLHDDTVRRADELAHRPRPYVRRAGPWRPLDALLGRTPPGAPAPAPVPAPATSGRRAPAGVHPAAWAQALALAGGRAGRLHVVSPTEILVR